MGKVSNKPLKKEKPKNSTSITLNSTKKQHLQKAKKSAEIKEKLLPSVTNFFEESKGKRKDDDSSDDEVQNQIIEKGKMKKLTNAERKQLLQAEEERLRKIERENMEASVEPQTVEQFEKYMKGEPNDSKMWSKYIAHLVFHKEIEKAKAIAREAIETISINLPEERYNMWLVLLNLENSYGDKNQFEEVFAEAVKRNDDLSIYLDTINILYLSGKYAEMEEKISKAKKKYKQYIKMYYKIAEIYYQLKKFAEARNLRDIALKTMDKKLSITITVKFAIMEFQIGEKDQGEGLFESILQFYPNRVDVWSTYVDQLVKLKDIDIARRILNRAVSQKLPPKKSKVLFNKFKRFEIEHGDQDTINNVIKLAQNYVNSQ